MKINQIIKNIWVIGLLILGLSCQEESIKVDLPDEEEQLSTQAASLLSRISLKDGSSDNIVDGGSCLSIQLPIEAIVNDTLVNIYSEDDYELVEEILDEYDNDQDTVIIQFPIIINFSDYTSTSVNDLDTLEDLIDDCVEEGLDDDIECIDIIYPIQISAYNSLLQQAKVVDIDNDQNLYYYLENVSEDLIINLIFPISLLSYTGERIVVSNQSALVATIAEFEDSCDEDDDLDFDDDDEEIEDTSFKNVLFTNLWVVESFDSAATDLSFYYEAILISFFSDQTLQAEGGNDLIIGDWGVYSENEHLVIRFDFDTDNNLNLLNEDWVVVNFNNQKIELKNKDIDYPLKLILHIN